MNRTDRKIADRPQEDGADKAIDTVLAGLRDTKARAGMNDRILAALAEQAAAPVRSGWRFGLPSHWSPGYRYGGALAGICLALTVFALHRPLPAPSHDKLQPVMPRPLAQAPVEVTRTDERLEHRPVVRRVVLPRATQAEVVDDAHVASFPAPPMPLTEQEKLLLRVIHKNDPVELAMLNPEERLRQEARGKDDFVRFFDPSAAADAKKN